ncbi:MAG: hypothetical protein WDN69_20220 [Aliidongia sp.]
MAAYLDPNHAVPHLAGCSAERLERITTHLESQYIETGRIQGCQLAVMRRGHLAYFRSFGLMDRERARRWRPTRSSASIR